MPRVEVFDPDWVRLVLNGTPLGARLFLLALVLFPVALVIGVIGIPVVWLFEWGWKGFVLTTLAAWVLIFLFLSLLSYA